MINEKECVRKREREREREREEKKMSQELHVRVRGTNSDAIRNTRNKPNVRQKKIYKHMTQMDTRCT